MDFKTSVLAMAKARPNAPVSLIVDLALALEDFASELPTVEVPKNLDDANELAAWAKSQPEVKRFLDEDKRIHAIKEVRTRTGASLMQAKNAVDIVKPYQRYEY